MTNYFTRPHYVAYLVLPSGEEIDITGEYQGGGSYTREREDDGIYLNEVDQPEFDINLVHELEDGSHYILTVDQHKAIKSQFIKQYWDNVE